VHAERPDRKRIRVVHGAMRRRRPHIT
jgi:hypothetical protein